MHPLSFFWSSWFMFVLQLTAALSRLYISEIKTVLFVALQAPLRPGKNPPSAPGGRGRRARAGAGATNEISRFTKLDKLPVFLSATIPSKQMAGEALYELTARCLPQTRFP
ncbi:hypothetical protein EVAR_42778_1 [Eumeta japonica]|uniref:Uncharacterized protein n=1 Tax=Eumeta variegata TaxID=151549 RepID=A0A4C1WNA0_EUMVA|nr:hypothetical protein EVAR_42778_1 [Eumeta japonica]